MKAKIQRLSKGDFHLEKPGISFDETNIVIIIGEGEIYKGSIHIRSNTTDRIRGLIYPSSLRVSFKEQGFEGTDVRIEYTYDGRGLLPGHVEHGKFSVVCDVGEYDLAFTAITEKPYVTTAYGKVQSTEDFRKLAIKDFSEAARLFRSKEFYEILKYEDERIFYLYDNMRKWSLGEQSLEEFLVGIKQKECIFLTLQGEGMLFEDVADATKGTLTIMKNTWGFMPVKIQAEGEFIKLARTEITTDDFVGNAYEFEYFVRPEKLHGGRNFGMLKFVTPYETLTYEVEVIQNGKYNEDHRMAELYMAQILKGYIRFSSGKGSLKEWVLMALKNLKLLRELEPQNDMYQLLTAHIKIRGKQEEEAKWILENYNYNRFALVKDYMVNAYYLYLTALLSEDSAHYQRVIGDLEKTYVRHQESWFLLWMIMDIDKKYKNPTKRLSMLEQHFAFGNHTVTFYMESFLCYREKPELLKKLGDFELQVLNFASKYQLITRDMALYLANFASQQKFYSEKLFKTLERTYELYDESIILNAITTLLIKGNKVGSEYFKWYKLAVEADFKIAKLYDYYMITVDENVLTEALPRVLYLYYMHGNNLDFRKCAFLYASLVTFEKEAGDLYLAYREQMVKFTRKQLLQRHITESLKILYKRFLKEEEMSSEQIEAMRDICFSYLVTTKVKGMHQVLVIEKNGEIEQRVPYRENGAIIYLYDKEARVIWESKEGRYYTDSIAYDTKRLFYEPRFLELCKRYAYTTGAWQEVATKETVTLENLYNKGIAAFNEKEVLSFISRVIRESDYKEDKAVTYFAIELFNRGQYDKATLTYLAEFYLGSSFEMKRLYQSVKEYEVQPIKLAERIITQVVFSEEILDEEPIFLDYYTSDSVYFRIKQAYLALVSKEYLVNCHLLKQGVFDIILRECFNGEDLADVCKIALIKWYSDKEFQEDEGLVLKAVMTELCEKKMVLPFFMNYPSRWLRELQIYDKVYVSYQTKKTSRVILHYKLRRGNKEELSFRKEALMPVFDGFYVKDFVLYEDETLVYYFKEVEEEEIVESERMTIQKENIDYKAGKFGKLNKMIKVSEEERKALMVSYEEEEIVGKEFYLNY
ncbi:MAG TPA: hypothetical protein H9887_00560 [Candidatus Dorea intestinavium]|nr:hypothetical protein [Candidatus Dorea intestinavium]